MLRVSTATSMFKWLYRMVGGQRMHRATNVIDLLKNLACTVLSADFSVCKPVLHSTTCFAIHVTVNPVCLFSGLEPTLQEI
jgi:hypothetical protein